MIKKIKSILKKRSFKRWFLGLIPFAIYAKWLKSPFIDKNVILLESQHGTEISGNMFYILRTLATDKKYSKFKLYISSKSKSKSKIKKILKEYKIDNVDIVKFYSPKYMKLVATAGYLFNDNTFLPFFTKKEGQIYVNTWHGTPLKTLGRGIKNGMHNIGNTQKNFLFADYLLYPNKYTMKHMVDDYMLENIATGKCVLNGYPRNTVFFDTNRRKELRKKEETTEKIYAYMPTWRGTIGVQNAESDMILTEYLAELDSKLNNNETLYVNLHPVAIKSIDFSGFNHIKKFPSQYETYDFLNCTDCLITDYSSVFYDYAVTRKKCVLFTYDEEEYFADRGVYMSLSELPFPKVKTVDELITEIRSPKSYNDTEFLNEYCTYDCGNATNNLLDLVFENKKTDKTEIISIPNNGKKNVLLHAGNLDRNGVTTSIYNLLRSVNKDECNYYITFPAICGKHHQDTLMALPEGIGYIPMHGSMNLSIYKDVMWHAFLAMCLLKKNAINVKYILKLLKNEWNNEIRRNFGDTKFDSAIQFTGYGPKMILMFSQFEGKTSIYVHNDMVQEIKTRGNQRKDVLEYAYNTYDNVALVTEDLFEPTSSFVESTDNFKVVHNVIAYEEAIRRGEEELAFDEGITRCNVEFEELKEILESDAKVFVSVGRFSPEKGHQRMVDAFNKVWMENNNTYFVIIGGNQFNGLYDKLTEYVETLPCAGHIILVLSMSNPLPLVKACDGFILGSYYEGFGLVIVEADILGLPAVSTDITGPRIFMNNNGGTLVEDSDEGVEKGFRLLLEGKVPMLTTDYKKYNENAVNEFYSLLQ